MKKLIFAITCLLLAIQCSAEIIVVEPDGSGDQPTIQAAIDAAHEGDEVVLSIGTYTGDSNRDIDFFGKAITLRSTNPNDPDIVAATIINCEDNGRGFYFHSGEANGSVLDGLTITNGYAERGGGIYCEASNPAISNCTFTGNSAGRVGGAMYNTGSNPAITNCVFTYNSALSSGAIFNHDSGPVITNCSFTGNLAFEGGAMSNAGSHPVITNCTFSGNSAGRGGAMFNYQSNPAITNCAFTGNMAKAERVWRDGGGAIYNFDSNPAITNCTFIGNLAKSEIVEVYGGAMYNYRSSPTITNCAFTGNMAKAEITGTGNGGAMYNRRYSSPAITNCILWGNVPNQIVGSSVVTYSNVQGGWNGEGNINKNPHFAFDTDLHLMPDSPCIEAGDPNYVAGPNETDLDGNPRVAGARIDMGAYEYIPAAPCIAVSSRRITFAKYRPQGLEKSLQIRNCGLGELKWELTEDCPWLEVSPIKGTSSGEINEVTLTADADGLSVGEYRCRITITGGSAINSPVTIDVILYVGTLLHVPGEYSTIQDAVDAANDWDTVLVADGVYKGIGNRDIDFNGRKIQLKNENGADNCIIDCSGANRGFYFHSGEDADSALNGLTVTNGYAQGGGGIYCGVGSPAITNCTFSSNSARSGGAIYNIGGNLAITNCTFTGNSARYGGAMYNRYGGPTTNCTFTGNSAERDGGAMLNLGGNPAITNCTFSGNSAKERGGAMSNAGSNPAITNCTFTGNSAKRSGGAMYNGGSNPAITNCILWGDGPQEIFNYGDSNPVITYSDVQGGWDGEGNIDIDPCFVEPGFWHPNDTPLDANDDFWVEGDYHLKSQTGRWKPSIYLGLDPTNDGFIDLSDFAAFANSWQEKGSFIPADLNRSGIVDLSDLDLLLDNYLAGYPLREWVLDDVTSPCIDAGDPNYIPEPNETDLDGNPRIAGGIIDMGAYEAPLGPLDLLIELNEHIDAMNLPKGTANSLKAKLNAALRLLEDDNENNDVAAVNLLEAFINAVQAQYDKKIPAADADALIAAAQEIITLLDGE